MPDHMWTAIDWEVQFIEFEDGCGAVRIGDSHRYVDFDGDHKGVEATVVVPDDPDQAARVLAVVRSPELNGADPSWGDMSVWHEGRRSGEWVVRWRYSWRSSRAEVEKAAQAVVAVLRDGFGLTPAQVRYRSTDDSIPGREDFYFPSDRPTDRDLGEQAADWAEFTERLAWVARTLQQRAVLILRAGEAMTVRFRNEGGVDVRCDVTDPTLLGNDSAAAHLTVLGWTPDGDGGWTGGRIEPYENDATGLAELAVATLRTIRGIDDPRQLTFESYRDELGRDDLWYIDAELGIPREPGTAVSEKPSPDEDSVDIDRAAIADAVNSLTDDWIEALDDPSASTVISAPALWPLLALLLSGADEFHEFQELGYSVGLDEHDALGHARFFLDLVRRSPAVDVSVGMWHRDDIGIESDWAEGLPDGVTVEPFEPERVRKWVDERTGGFGDDFRRALNPHSPLVLISALAVRTTWAVPFADFEHTPAAGPWMGRRLAAVRRLGVNTSLVWSTENATCALVTGLDDVNVMLVAGEPGASPAAVLNSGAETLSAGPSILDIGYTGPGVTVEAADSDTDVVEFIVPRFTIRAEHDLLRGGELSDDWFGACGAYYDDGDGDRETDGELTADDFDEYGESLPMISEQELLVGEARQVVPASFTATGFGMEGPPAPPENIPPPIVEQPRKITVCLDRPFGFYIIQKSTSLVLGAGWVAEPEFL
ncbi:TY-Chap domain-containing protein [Nocardia sp. NPDC055321]